MVSARVQGGHGDDHQDGAEEPTVLANPEGAILQ